MNILKRWICRVLGIAALRERIERAEGAIAGLSCGASAEVSARIADVAAINQKLTKAPQ